MRHIQRGHFDDAVGMFDANMAKALPKKDLKAVWTSLETQLGAFEEVTRVRVQSNENTNVSFVTCRFEKGSIDAKIGFDDKGRVTGLFFVPLAKAWAPPAYVERSSFEDVSLSVGVEPQLDGKLAIPKGSKRPVPAVVLIHGSGPADLDGSLGVVKPFRDIAWGLATRGIAVLRYNKRTFQRPESMPQASPYTVDDEVIRDAVAAAKRLRDHRGIDPSRVVVLGHSLGGTLVPRILAASEGLAGGVILAGSARPIPDLVVEQVRYLAELDGTVDADELEQIESAEQFRATVQAPELRAKTSVELFGSATPGSYWLDLRDYDPIAQAQKQRGPLLILHGSRDYQVTEKDLRLWRDALSDAPRVRIQSLRGLNHLFVEGSGPSSPAEYSQPGHVSKKVIDEIERWIGRLEDGR